MKKSLRLLALITAVMLLCLSFTGCSALDDMRARHGIFADDGSIHVNGEKYLRLPDNAYFSPIDDSFSAIYVTGKDVPVLLASFSDNVHYIYDSGDIIENDSGTQFYCREKLYASLAPLMEAPFAPTGYCYAYSTFDIKDHSYSTQFCRLSNTQANLILEVTTNEELIYSEKYDVVDGIIIQACSDNLLLRDSRYELFTLGNGYVIFDFVNDIAYSVPAQYNSMCEAIMKPYWDAQKAEEAYWEGTYDNYDGEVEIVI